MNSSSAQESYSITSLDALDTITISNSSFTSSASSSTVTLTYPTSISGTGGISYVSGMTVGGVTSGSGISTIDWSSLKTEEFVDSFPSYDKIQSMCKEYPGLKIAYEKFVTTYKLVKDDYDTPKDQRPKP